MTKDNIDDSLIFIQNATIDDIEVAQKVSNALMQSLEYLLIKKIDASPDSVDIKFNDLFIKNMEKCITVAIEHMINIGLSSFFNELSELDISFCINSSGEIDKDVLLSYFNKSHNDLNNEIIKLSSLSGFEEGKILDLLQFVNSLKEDIDSLNINDNNTKLNSALFIKKFIGNKIKIYSGDDNLSDISDYAVLNLFDLLDIESGLVMKEYFNMLKDMVKSLSNIYELKK